MLCEFQLTSVDPTTGKNHVRCRRCGRTGTTPHPPERFFAECRSPVWIGLGDAVAWLTHVTRIDRAVKVWSQWRGRPCGCAGRQRRLNSRLPLPPVVRGWAAYLVSAWRFTRPR